MTTQKNISIFGIFPILLFLITFASISLMADDFYHIPAITSFFIASLTSLLLGWKFPLEKRIQSFTKSAGHPDIITMVLIFILAGIFSELARLSGAANSIVQLGIYWIPTSMLVPGLFILSGIVSFAMGSSVGVIVTIGPIGYELAQSSSNSVNLIIGAIVSGAMFGDNLSLISDTTIAAVNSQHCNMDDKLKFNSRIAIPAALITTILYALASNQTGNVEQAVSEDLSYFKVLPYFSVVLLALWGLNVFYVMTTGVFCCLALILSHPETGISMINILESASKGLNSMLSLSVLSMLSAGLVGLIHLYGGMNYILEKVSSRIQSTRSASTAIAALACIIDICTANNTVSIIIASPLATEIKQKFGLNSKAVASYLDIFASCVQGVLPYGAQLLFAAQIAKTSPWSISPYVFYCMVLFLSASLKIQFSRSQSTSTTTGI